MTNHMNELKGRDLDMVIAKEILGFVPREEDLRTEELIPFHSNLNRALALCKKIGFKIQASETLTPEDISWRCLEHWRLALDNVKEEHGEQLAQQVKDQVLDNRAKAKPVLTSATFGTMDFGEVAIESGPSVKVRLTKKDKETVQKIKEAVKEGLWAEPSELVFDSFRGSGQKTNQCESGVKVTHLPTGLSSEFDGHRSHLQNREEALRLLKEKVQEGIALMFLSCGVVVDQDTVSWGTWVEYRKQVADWNEKKPPIGVEPQSYWEDMNPEPTNEQIIERMKELNGAIFRYYGAGRSPLREWIEEFYSLSSKIK